MGNRKDIRQALATLLSDNIATLVAVYDHETVNFEGKSPVAMVHSDGVGADELTESRTSRRYAYIITLMWKRTDDDATEDYLDDLSDNVTDLIVSNIGTTSWKRIYLDEQFSEMDYPLIDDTLYRRERMRVLVDYTG